MGNVGVVGGETLSLLPMMVVLLQHLSIYSLFFFFFFFLLFVYLLSFKVFKQVASAPCRFILPTICKNNFQLGKLGQYFLLFCFIKLVHFFQFIKQQVNIILLRLNKICQH
jgi:hypothetical protein